MDNLTPILITFSIAILAAIIVAKLAPGNSSVLRSNACAGPIKGDIGREPSGKSYTPTAAWRENRAKISTGKTRGSSKCFRIRMIPHSWDQEILLEKLCELDASLRDHKFVLSVCSQGSTQTALLEFEDSATVFFDSLVGDENHVGPEDIVIDQHFFGFTVLYSPAGDDLTDIIAVTGLAGHAFGSWRHRETRKMWLRDFLPDDLKSTRIITYGYDSRLDGSQKSQHSLLNFKRTFLEELENLNYQDGTQRERPLFFIGHSLGGLLVLQILLESNKNIRYAHILRLTKGVMFFGTPHDGLRTEELEKAIMDVNSRAATSDSSETKWRNHTVELIRQLSPGSDYLEQLREDASDVVGFLGNRRIISFYESARTNTVRTDANGNLERSEQKAIMVERFSAVLRLPSEQRYEIGEDHSNMVKFKSRAERAYQTVVRCASEIISTTNTAQFLGKLKDGRSSWKRVIQILKSPEIPKTVSCGCPSQDWRYFWVFRNPTYKKWLSSPSTELLSVTQWDSRFLNDISCLIAEQLADIGYNIFYFTCRAPPAIDAIAFVHTFLRKILSISNEQQGLQVVHTFLKTAYEESRKGVSGATPMAQYKTEEEIVQMLLKSSHHIQTKALEQALNAWIPEDVPLAVIICEAMIQGKDASSSNTELIDIISILTKAYRCKVVLIQPWGAGGTSQFVHLDHSHMIRDCLSTLKIETYRYDNIAAEYQGSYESWLPSHDKYRAWLDGPDSSLLLVIGKPGSGKSTLCKYVLRYWRADDEVLARVSDSVQEALSPSLFEGSTQGVNGSINFAGFFYSDRDKETSHVTMLKTLLCQVLERNTDLFHLYFDELINNKGNWTLDSLIKVLLSLSKHPFKQHIYILVDAFDESEIENEERETVIEAFRELCMVRGPCVTKIFVASRPVNQLPDTNTTHSLYLHQHTTSDITRYTRHFLAKLRVSEKVQAEMADRIIERAEGVFVWVKLVGIVLTRLDQKGSTRNDLSKALDNIPTDLAKMYQSILNGTFNDKTDGWDDADIYLTRKLFSYILFASRPLTVDELRHVLAVDYHSDPDVETAFLDEDNMLSRDGLERRIIHCGRNLIEFGGCNKLHQPSERSQNQENGGSIMLGGVEEDSVGARPVQLMHQTVRTYLLQPIVLAELQIKESETHLELARSGVRYLHFFCAEATFFLKQSKWTGMEDIRLVRYIQKWAWINHALQFLPTYLKSCGTASETTVQCIYELGIQLENSTAVSILLHRWAENDRFLQQTLDTRKRDDNDAPPPPSASSSLPQSKFSHICPNRLLAVATVLGETNAAEFLLHCGADLESQTFPGRTPLHWAAEKGQAGTVRYLLSQRANTAATDGHGESPLHLAVFRGHESVVRVLVGQAGVDADSRNRENLNRTPLSRAAERGYEAIVQLLSNREDVQANSTDDTGRTPLSWAAGMGHHRVVQILANRAEVDANSKDIKGRTPLGWAAYNGHEETVRLLIGRDDVCNEPRDKGDRTPLHYAAHMGNASIVQYLAEISVELDLQDRSGWSPLSLAARHGHGIVVQQLANRANVNADSRDGKSRSPLSLAAREGHVEIVQFLADRAGVDPDSLDGEFRRTPLSWAAQNGHEFVVRDLANRARVNPDSRDTMGRTPLAWAAIGGHTSVLQFLAERDDVSCDSSDSMYRRTALSWAAAWGQYEAVIQLLSPQLNVVADSRDITGRTPLSWAAEGGHLEIAKLLASRTDVNPNSIDKFGWTPLLWAAAGCHDEVVRMLRSS